LDEKYVPKTASKKDQMFMYAVLEEKLKSEKGKSMINEFEEKRNAQCVFCELKKHALGSTVVIRRYFVAVYYDGPIPRNMAW
jgi:hypothetical protein